MLCRSEFEAFLSKYVQLWFSINYMRANLIYPVHEFHLILDVNVKSMKKFFPKRNALNINARNLRYSVKMIFSAQNLRLVRCTKNSVLGWMGSSIFDSTCPTKATWLSKNSYNLWNLKNPRNWLRENCRLITSRALYKNLDGKNYDS